MYEIGLCMLLRSPIISEYSLAFTINTEKCSIALGVKKTLEITLAETEEFHLVSYLPHREEILASQFAVEFEL